MKILRDKTHTALLNSAILFTASLAAHFMKGQPLFDAEPGLQIAFSKNAQVKLNSATGGGGAAPVDNRTRAFQPTDQRFNPMEIEKFIRSVCAPTKTLFIANLREDFSEAALKQAVEKYASVVAIQARDGPGRQQTQIRSG